jgi:mannose-6-phosphate isomerase-like protein (cupin superfamily)
MTPIRIERWDADCDGPLSEASLERKIESLGFEVLARTYPAGRAFDAPPESRDSIAAVVRGVVRLTVDGEPATLNAGDIAVVPREAVRRIEAAGAEPALCLEAYPRREPPVAPDEGVR